MNTAGLTEDDLKNQSILQWKPLIDKFIPERGVAYDIGAFRGVTAQHLNQMGFSVKAFEGSPRNFSYLAENINELSEIVGYQIALHTKTYETMTRFNDCLGREHPLQKVNYYVFEEFLKEQKIPEPSLIKMDIEGMESVVLSTMGNLIEQKPHWILSVHPGQVGYGEDYPGWVPTSRGGFPINSLLDTYIAYNPDGTEVFNLEVFGEFFLCPKP